MSAREPDAVPKVVDAIFRVFKHGSSTDVAMYLDPGRMMREESLHSVMKDGMEVWHA